MSSKEEKPTLAGATLKTRKRNISVPLDPGSFADAVITIINDAKTPDAPLDKNLAAAVKGLEGVDLDFSRYGETLFEVLFAGGRMAGGGNVISEGKKLDTSVLAAEPTREAIMPYMEAIKGLVRRRPFLIRSLENTLVKLILSLEFYDDVGRQKIAIAMARVFVLKVGVLPDRVLVPLLNDRMVAKGTILAFVTEFFADFLATDSVDDLVALLKKARLDERLLEFFPPQQRTLEQFNAHFKAHGMQSVVDYNNGKVAQVHLAELATQLEDMVTTEPPVPVADAIALCKAQKAEWNLPEVEILKVLWNVLIGAVPLGGKNHQQIQTAVAKQVKRYQKLLEAFSGSARLEAALMVHIQVYCYEDPKLLKLFSAVIRILYDADILDEDTIKFWYKKGSHPKGRNVFQRDMEPFLKWLDEAEEEEEE